MSMILEKCFGENIAIRYLLRLAIPLARQRLQNFSVGFARDDGLRFHAGENMV
jgi:hypothetical protein